MVRRWLPLIALFLCADSAWAATYYVRKDGSDTVCSGQTDAPAVGAPSCAFLTVQKGVDAAVSPGDRVIIHAGTYFEAVSVRVSGVSGAVTTIQGAPGETVILDAGEREFRTPGNNDWELVDATIGEYRSVLPHVGTRVYGYIDGVPNYENGRVGLVPYSDTRAELGGGLPGFRPFRATSDEYVDGVTPFYVGPGLWLGRQCTGGTSPGAACETSADCGGGVTCAATNRIHIRLSKTADMRSAEARYGTVLSEENADPRNYSLIISLAPYTMRVYGAYLRLENLVFSQSLRTVNLESGSHDLVFDGVTVWVGDSGIAAEQPVNPPHHVTVTRSRVYGDSPYWIFWSDSKDVPYPALKMNGTDIHIANGAHDWEVSYDHIRGGMDGLSTNTNEYNISVHHNRIENLKDDSLEIEGVVDVGRVAVFENYIGNCLNGFAPGQQSPLFTGPALYYRNVVSLLRDPPINRKVGLNMFNGGFRYGHEYAFKQRSPNTFYYQNTVVLLNSHDKGMNVVPGEAGDQNDTYVFNNIYVKVNRLVQGPYFTGSGQVVDNNLYWKMNTDDTDPLLDVFDTVPSFSAARGLELHGLGSTPKTGTNPRFKTWSLLFDKSVPRRWSIGANQEVWNSSDFLLESGSPAFGAGRALPTHPRFGLLPDSRSSRVDLGAIPSTATAAEWSQFPFNQRWGGPVSGVDLVVTSITNPPTGALLGGSFSVSDATLNQGVLTSTPTANRYYLSADLLRSGEDKRLIGARSIPGLSVGASSSGATSVTIPPDALPGQYYLLSCADDDKAIVETQDANNCRASAGRIAISAPDLIETSISNPPGSAAAGTGFSLSDTALNQGNWPARISTTRYYLSLDGALDGSDRLLTGSRTVPTLAAGASSFANVTVTVPATTPAASYLVLACADDTDLMIESSETNNCAASSSRLQVLVRDLTTSALSDPVGPVVAGNSASTFTTTDTVVNLGQVTAPATVSRYYLSRDSSKSADDYRLSATRSVPALDPGAASTGPVTLTAPATVPEGAYFLVGCADDTALVAESNETNNCRSSVAKLTVTLPDLVESAVSIPSNTILVGQGFPLTDTVLNQGTGLSKTSTTRYFLSNDAVKSADDLLLSKTRSVPGIAAGGTSTGTATQTVPVGTPFGTYQLIVCSDDLAVVTESNESNNCRLAPAPVLVTAPDLVVSSLGSPPSAVTASTGFSLADTTSNNGQGPSTSATTRFYLSRDAVKDAADIVIGSRLVGGLAAGASSAGSTTLIAPASAAGGAWFIVACADDANALLEASETNNCRASSALQVNAPDLVVSMLGNPPASIAQGAGFTIADTLLDQGLAPAAATTTGYYLSLDGILDPTDTSLIGSLAAPAISPGASYPEAVPVRVPATLASGTYTVLACADNGKTVPESNETNNCRASGGRVIVAPTDLVETAVSEPPASAVAGSTFAVTDSVVNQGTVSAGSSQSRGYLSLDRVKDPSDAPLDGIRALQGLAPGATSTGSLSVVISPTMPSGSYYLVACADDKNENVETNETNNCIASTGVVQVQVKDLLTTAISDPPATTVAGNGSYGFTITDTVVNQGQLTAPATTTRYYVSLDAVRDSSDFRFNATRAIPSLAPGGSSTGTVTVIAPSAAPEGLYYVLACADDTLVVPEGSETNNCKASSTQVRVLVPDLVESTFTNPPLSVQAGLTFAITETVLNQGSGPARNSTTRYYLSSDAVRDPADLLFVESRAVRGLAPSESTKGTVTVTVPASTPAGFYYVLACADDLNAMPEISETNNCRTSARQIQILP